MPDHSDLAAPPAYPFAYRDFRLFWTARLAAMLAMSCLVLAIGWLVYDIARQTMGIRGASLRLGLIGLVQFLPILAFTPIAGVVVDKAERRNVVRFALALQAVGAALLGALTYFGWASLPAIYTVAMLLGTARAFLLPAMNALAPALVPRDVLPARLPPMPWRGGLALYSARSWAALPSPFPRRPLLLWRLSCCS